MGQTAGFAVGAWIVRHPPRDLCFEVLYDSELSRY